MPQFNTISTAYKYAAEKKVAFVDVQLIVSHVTKETREFVIAHPEYIFRKNKYEKVQSLLRLRAMGKPLAYILGYKDFFKLRFIVNEKTLIPRPETEFLVEEALAVIPSCGKAVKIADVGTGSGCVAVSIASNSASSILYALDISIPALKVARRNVLRAGLNKRVCLYKSNLLSALKQKPVDVVVANLPYIADLDSAIDDEVKKYEPHIALFGGELGIELYMKLLAQIKDFLWKPHYILLEVGYGQKRAITQLAKKMFPKSKMRCKNDLAGIPRICTICLSHV